MGGTSEGRITRRSLVSELGVVVTGAAGAALLGGCAIGRPSASSAGSAALDVRGVAVEYWDLTTGPTHPESMAKVKVMERFNAENTLGVTVNISAIGSGVPADHEKLVAAIAGDAPPDISNTHNFFMSAYAAAGATVDVETELKGDATWKQVRPAIYPHILKALTWKGKLYAIPSHNSFFLMYYQGGLLKRAGLNPPTRTWTWDTFADYCKRASRPPEVTGYDSGWIYPDTVMTCLNNEAPFVSQDGTKFLLTSAEVTAAVEWEASLLRAGLMRPHDGTASGGYREYIPQQKVVFQRAVPARIPVYRRDGVEFGTCYYPLGPSNKTRTNYTQGSAYGFTVFGAKDARRVYAALQASLWAARPESGLIFAREGGVPPSYKHIVDAPAFQAEFKPDAEMWPFFEVLPGFIPYWSFPTFWDARSVINTQLMTIWAGKVSVRDGLAEAQRQAQELLDRALRGP